MALWPAGLATGPSGGGGSSGDACSGGVAVTSEENCTRGRDRLSCATIPGRLAVEGGLVTSCTTPVWAGSKPVAPSYLVGGVVEVAWQWRVGS